MNLLFLIGVVCLFASVQGRGVYRLVPRSALYGRRGLTSITHVGSSRTIPTRHPSGYTQRTVTYRRLTPGGIPVGGPLSSRTTYRRSGSAIPYPNVYPSSLTHTSFPGSQISGGYLSSPAGSFGQSFTVGNSGMGSQGFGYPIETPFPRFF